MPKMSSFSGRVIIPLAVGLLALGFLTFTACSSQSAGSKPDDMSADEHQEHSGEHQKKAEEHQEQYDPDARSTRSRVRAETQGDVTYKREVYNPTEFHNKLNERHKRHAEQHQKAAEQLRSFEEDHCSRFPEETRAACPLMGQIEKVDDIERGVQLTFADGAPVEAIVDHMKCHFAFARADGYEGMDQCPLYLEGVSIEREEDEDVVTVTTQESEAVEALRERSRAHLE